MGSTLIPPIHWELASRGRSSRRCLTLTEVAAALTARETRAELAGLIARGVWWLRG